MKIVSWNVNGLRAVHRKGAWADFMMLDADIIGLQETKMERGQLAEDLREIPGYTSYWNSSKTRKGYSGTAMYIKDPLAERLIKIHYDLIAFDRVESLTQEEDTVINKEGRLIVAEFDSFVVATGYFPNGGRSIGHVALKLTYYDEFMSFMESFRNKGKEVIFCGDVNTAHTEIDLARPKENATRTGFLPEEREWIDEMVAIGYVDTLRELHPDKAEMYTWWDVKTRARERNVGWRIDYVFVSEKLMPKVTHATIHTSITGSDHCPVSVGIKI